MWDSSRYPLFQPADHVPCDAWTGYYLSNDLRTLRAFPGEAERARGELADDPPGPEMTLELERSWAPLPLPPDPRPPAAQDG